MAAAAAGAAAARAVMRQNAPAHWLGDSTVEQMWGGSVSVSSAGPVAIPMEAIEAAAKAAVEAALATRIPTTVTISAPSSPARVMGGPPDRSKAPADMQATTSAYVSVSPERPTVGDSSHVAATSEARARLLAAKDAIEEVGSAPPEVAAAKVVVAKRRKKRAKAPSSASAHHPGLSRSTVEERQARQLAAMQAHVDAITAARRERSHVSRLRNYWV